MNPILFRHTDEETEAQRAANWTLGSLGTLSSLLLFLTVPALLPTPPHLLQSRARPETQDCWEISTHGEVCHPEVQAIPLPQTCLFANPCSGGSEGCDWLCTRLEL